MSCFREIFIIMGIINEKKAIINVKSGVKMIKEKVFTCSVFNNEYSKHCITQSLKECNSENAKPIFVCIGSDLVLGDSLGPLVGTFLRSKELNSYIYGTLNSPITAKEVSYAGTYLRRMHENTLIVSIDAAVGDESDVGLIKIINRGLKPGLGVNKDLDAIGDVSIIGVVAGKSTKNYNLFNMTRLNFVYKMAQTIADGIENYITENFSKKSKRNNCRI